MKRLVAIMAIVSALAASAAFAGNFGGSISTALPSGAHVSCVAGTVGPTPTPTASPTPSTVLPMGVPSPQSGSWVLQTNGSDNFNTEGGINTANWNGGPGGPSSGPGYFPLCHPSGDSSCYSGSGNVDDCLGYAGLDPGSVECGQVYTAQNGAGNTLSSTGLAVQDYNNVGGGGAYFSNEWAGLQNYGIVSLQPGSFVEWRAQLPHDNSGEGDGLHSDLWCTTNNRTILGTGTAGDEVDVNEHVGGTGNHNDTTAAIFDSGSNLLAPGNNYFYSAPGSPDLTAGMHTYGLWWKTGGGAEGQLQMFVDGSAIFGPVNIGDAGWASGAYCFAGWMQESDTWNGGDGHVADGSTSNSDPLLVQYFRYWKQQ